MPRESWTNGPLAAIGAYCAASILMTVTNKAILSSYEFHMNFLVLAVQNALTVVLLELFAYFSLASHRPFKQEEARRWFVVSLALVVMIYTGSKALQYMSIPLFTIFKNLTIVIIAYSELWFFNGARVTPLTLLSFLLMVFSSVIAGWSDISEGKVLKKSAETASFIVAYGWMILNCLTSAFFALIMRAKIKEVQFKDFDTVFYNNLLSVPVLLVCSFLMEGDEYRKTVVRFSEGGEGADQFWGLVVALVISSVSAFAISYGSAWCVRVTSSTTYSMVGALNKLPIAVAGMMFFDDPITFAGVLGVIIAFSAGILYTYSKSLPNKPAGYSGLPLPATDRSSGSKDDTEGLKSGGIDIDDDRDGKQQR
ncbi:GDP-mannose transporter [Dinochytrium kinnereticum]|nr:GDP-mannose transporter [Dinochytrium kinnereticum]